MNRLSETLREAIEEEVATGKLAPGTHLDEIELAKRFGVSRTPIREALSLLAGEGVVDIRPRRGAELIGLEQAHESCRSAAQSLDSDGYFYANEHFHHAIYVASHNSFLSDQAHALQRRLRPYRRLQLRVRNRLAKSYDEHQGVLDALRDGDGDRAASAIRSHVMVQGERFNDLLAGLSQLEAQAQSAVTTA